MSAHHDRTDAHALRARIIAALREHGPHALGDLSHRLAHPHAEVRTELLSLIGGRAVERCEPTADGVRYRVPGWRERGAT